MRLILAIGLGGFLGSILRYLMTKGVQGLSPSDSFPLGTLTVNVVGCLVLGFLGGLADNQGMFGPEARAFLFFGVLGGFTTFSTFGYDTTKLADGGEYAAALINVGLSVMLGLSAAWLGYRTSMLVR